MLAILCRNVLKSMTLMAVSAFYFIVDHLGRFPHCTVL